MRLFNEIMETIRKVKRVEAVRVDEECPILLSDYLEKIAGDIYLTLGEFCGENYVSVRRYYTDRELETEEGRRSPISRTIRYPRRFNVRN